MDRVHGGGKLQKVNIAGGPPQIICDALGPTGNSVGTWGSQGTIVFMQIGKPLQKVSESGGMPAVVFPFDAAREEWGQRDPYFLPDGKRFLYHSSGKETGIVLASVDGQIRRFLFSNGHSAASYAPNPAGGGWILYVGGGQQLFARPFDPDKGEFSGEAALVAANVPDGPSWSASSTGLLIFPTVSSFQSRLTWVGRDGKPLGTLGEAGQLGQPRISPDQKTVAFVEAQNQRPDIWLFDLARGVPTRFTFDSGADDLPIWSPDGMTLLFSGYRGSDVVVAERPANGIGAEKVLYKQPAKAAWATATSFSKDNKWVALTEGAGNVRIVLLSRSDGKVVPYLQSESEQEGVVSPDGRWMLYSAYPSGRSDVFVQPVPQDFGGPGASGKWQISPAGGSQAMWRADGKEIFYIAPDGMMMAAPVESGNDFFRSGTPHPLFPTHLINLDDFRNYDVSRDGQRFLLPIPQGEIGNSALEAIVNWPQFLKKR